MTPLRCALNGASLGLFVLAAGCSYLGSAQEFDPKALDQEPGWLAVRSVPFVRQQGMEECGLAAVTMVLAYWDHPVGRDEMLGACPARAGEGIRAGRLRDYAKTCGLQAFLIHGDWSDFETELSRGHPIIVGMLKPYVTGALSHYEVVVAVQTETKDIVTLDPANGWRRNTSEGFRKEWDPAGRLTLILYKEKAEAPPVPGGD
jgi:ABC-type bacteriocin/lantibiotic exporter with double-glycine peptidase domain